MSSCKHDKELKFNLGQKYYLFKDVKLYVKIYITAKSFLEYTLITYICVPEEKASPTLNEGTKTSQYLFLQIPL